MVFSTVEKTMSALSDLKTALDARAAVLDDELERLECLALISEWYDCQVAVQALESTNVVSYSINGQTVTRSELSSRRTRAVQLYSEIKAMLFGGNVSHADCRFPIEMSDV